MLILLTGPHGQLGRALQPLLAQLGTVVALDRTHLDLADADAIRRAVRHHDPQLIVNAAAYTAVDRAEQETHLAMAINATAPGVLAEEAEHLGIPLIHYSTDYVFDGSRSGARKESDEPHPINAYGLSKWRGEQAVLATKATALIFRTSWVYGLQGQNFLNTMLRLGQEREQLQVVNDQTGAPTWTHSLAEATVRILSDALSTCPDDPLCGLESLRPHTGLFHMTNGGSTTWHEFAKSIFSLRPECHARLVPIASDQWPSPARRPVNSLLDNAKLSEHFHMALPHWYEALKLCLNSRPSGT